MLVLPSVLALLFPFVLDSFVMFIYFFIPIGAILFVLLHVFVIISIIPYVTPDTATRFFSFFRGRFVGKEKKRKERLISGIFS